MKKYVMIGVLVFGIGLVLVVTGWNMLQNEYKLKRNEFENVSKYLTEEYDLSLEEIPGYESVMLGPFGQSPWYRLYVEGKTIHYYPFSSDTKMNRAMKDLSPEELRQCFVFQNGVFHYGGDKQSIKDFLRSI